MKNKLLKIVTILTLILSLFVFTACGENDEEKNEKDSDVKTEAQEKEETKEEVMTEREATRLLEEYYDIADTMYFLAYDELDIDYGDGSEYLLKYKINNYEEIMDKYFSKKFAKGFEPALLIKENDEYYLGVGGFVEYTDDLRFEDIEIEKDKISCTVSCDVWIPDEKLEDDLKSDFVLIKDNGAWKIDEFTSYNQR